MLYRALLAFALCASALATDSALVDGEPDPRFFLFNTSDLSISLNSVLAGALALLGGLALLAGLAYLLFLLSGDSGSGYSGHSSGGDYASTGYTSYSSGRSAYVPPLTPAHVAVLQITACWFMCCCLSQQSHIQL